MSAEIATVSAPANAVEALAAGRQSVFSTLKADNVETRLALFSAVTASVPLADNLGKPIALANIVVQSIEMDKQDANGQPVYDQLTGEVIQEEMPRTILIDTEGVAYHGISKGLFRSVENLVGILGSDPTQWGGLKVVVTKEGSGNQKYFVMRPHVGK